MMKNQLEEIFYFVSIVGIIFDIVVSGSRIKIAIFRV